MPRHAAHLALALLAALLLAAPGAAGAQAQADAAAPPAAGPPPAAALLPFDDDPVLAELLEESLARRPELRQVDRLLRAERERVPQASAFPDPVLSLGIQNDGFQGIQIGKMETSFWQVMVTQPIPWPGKRGLRAEVAAAGMRLAEAGASRSRLTAEAEVRRAYLDLLLSRDRLALLTRLEALWQKAEGLARIRYEAGEGAQSDLLRAQLERNRQRQRRWALEAEARIRLEALNRLRGRPLGESLETTRSLADLALPSLPDEAGALADAERRSPELLQATLQTDRAARQVELARRDRWPDLAVTAAIMPRGGLEPMWQAGLSVSLPIFSSSRQGRAVAESEARAAASGDGVEALRQVLRQRVGERVALLGSLIEAAQLYRDGLLVQSRATAESTMGQYRVGRVTFASVLEAVGGAIADEDGALQAAAAAQRVAIAAAEVSLEPAGGGGGSLASGGVPGAGAMAGGAPASGGAVAGASSGGGGGAAGGSSGGGDASMTKM